MKRLITTALIIVSSISWGQDMLYTDYIPLENNKIDLHLSKPAAVQKNRYGGVTVSPSLGLGMIGGGAMFILAGALTTPTYVGGSTTILKPWYEQPGFWPIASGAALVVSGIVVTISIR
jgi:hypothetical protein